VLTAADKIKTVSTPAEKRVVQPKERKKGVEQVLGAILEGPIENFIKTHQS